MGPQEAWEVSGASGLELRLVRDHLLVKNAGNTNPARLQPVKHNMLPLFVPVKS